MASKREQTDAPEAEREETVVNDRPEVGQELRDDVAAVLGCTPEELRPR